MSTTKKDFEQYYNSVKEEFLKTQEKVIGEQGFHGSHIDEPKPSYNKADCEKVLEGKTNAAIVFGRDRSASKKSVGFTQAASIDIVVGRASSHKKIGGKMHAPPDKDVSVNPNFFADASRIHLSQKGDIDKYFALAKGTEPEGSSKSKAHIGIKSDHVRIVGRSHIKIVTGQAHQAGGDERLASGGSIEHCGRIDLIAGNYTDDEPMIGMMLKGKNGSERMGGSVSKLQPLVKGDNLEDCLNEMVELMGELSDFTFQNTNFIIELGSCLMGHFHQVQAGPFPGMAFPAAPGPSMYAGTGLVSKALAQQGKKLGFQFNLAMVGINYLTPAFASMYINSAHVSTT